MKLLIIGLGGFVGAILRYSLSGAIQSASKSVSFPYGTLGVNVVGCLLIGEGEGRHVVVWPPDFEVSTEGDLLWVFYDEHEFELRLGQPISLVGGEVQSLDAFDEHTRQQVPAGCSGPYWLVGSISPAGAIWAETTGGIAGTDWRLSFMDGETLIEGTEITLTIGEEHLAGTMSCNTYRGTLKNSGRLATNRGTLNVPQPLAVTRQTCSEPAGVMEQEGAYIEALQSATAYRMVLDTLQIADDVGRSTLVFERGE